MEQSRDLELEALVAGLEAILFTCNEPVPLEQLAQALSPLAPEEARRAAEELKRRLEAADRGLELVEVGGGLRLVTKGEHNELLQAFHGRVQKIRLTLASLETLAIVAYLQPVATPEIEAIRGVSVAQTLHGLVEKGLVRVVGRKEAPGRPLLYGTTEAFLEHFGLADLAALPRSTELERWKKEFRSGSPEPVSAAEEPVKSSSDKGE